MMCRASLLGESWGQHRYPALVVVGSGVGGSLHDSANFQCVCN